MSAVDTAQLRAALEQTGKLATRDDSDPGHISDYWRAKIAALIDAVDGGEVGSRSASPDIDVDQAQIDALVASAREALLDDVPAKWARACFLIREAMPRMRTLNNAHSARWLEMVDAFFSGDVS